MVMKKIILICVSAIFIAFQGNSQQKIVYGNVYAYKNLALNAIQVSSSKTKNTVQTDSLGKFRIVCEPTDKLEFIGEGFKKVVRKLEREEKIIKVKMIFKGGDKNIALAVENSHVKKDDLENSIQFHAEQNFEYYNYPDIFNAMSRIYAGNDNIAVRGNAVFVRAENATFSRSPAIFIVNGNLALDIIDIQTRNIESIEIIPDGSKQYGPGAANGVVLIKTFN